MADYYRLLHFVAGEWRHLGSVSEQPSVDDIYTDDRDGTRYQVTDIGGLEDDTFRDVMLRKLSDH